MTTAPVGISGGAVARLLTRVKDHFQDHEASSRDVVADIIKPLTHVESCSFIDILNSTPCETDCEKEKCATGKANVFVSHAWNASATLLLEALVAFAEAASHEDPVYFWLDICCYNQHELDHCGGAMPSDWWNQVLPTLIRDCGKVLVIATPIFSPEVCRRAWCLLEAAVVLHTFLVVASVNHTGQTRQMWLARCVCR
eukprot:m.742833 g.742833  ORF g.742833 m.742833 type:complete len:198 (-) comp23121_c1_seq15:3920-4513(-)